MASNTKIRIEEALSYLCRATVANFYAMTANSLERVYTRAISTMCVAPRRSKYTLSVNPDFADTLTFSQIVMILEHEMMHIVLNHVPRKLEAFRTLETDNQRRYFLIADAVAVDLAVNSMLRMNHSKEDLVAADACLPEYYGLPDGLTYEQYLAKMMHIFADIIPDIDGFIGTVAEDLKAKIEAAGGMPPDSIMAEVLTSVNKTLGVPTTLDEAMLFAEIVEENGQKVVKIPDHILEELCPEDRERFSQTRIEMHDDDAAPQDQTQEIHA